MNATQMVLFWSSRSPFVRKAMAAAHEGGVAGLLELRRVVVSATTPCAEVEAHNPLGKIPTLLRPGLPPLYDSPVICEYLAPGLLPASGEARWTALRLQALGDGLMDALVAWRAEAARAQRSAPNVDALARRFTVVLAGLERDPAIDGPFTLGQLSVACALSYADFRYADHDWRAGHPRLAGWAAAVLARPSMQATQHADIY